MAPPPLLPAFWPLTGAYAFLDSPVAHVSEALAAWRRGLDLSPEVEAVRGSLEVLLQRLTPMSLGHRELLLHTDSPWTAYFADLRTGADEAPVSYLARVLRCRAVYLIRWPVAAYEALRFQLIADHDTDFLNYERTVEVNRGDSGRAVFTAVGAVQPYEQTDAYRRRAVLERLTPAMVDDYCRVLGLRPFEKAFFLSDGVLVTSRNPRPDIEFTVEEQQHRYGYRPLTE